MDMAILGAPPQDYRAYAANVRREFESVFGPAAYCAGRIQRFIVPVMAAEYIFITPVMRDRYEAQAWLNIKAEKADLESIIAGIAGSSKQGTKAQP